MGTASRILLFLPTITLQILVIAALTDPNDLAALSGLKMNWKNTPPNWVGSDPCGAGWEGIQCTNSRITSIILAGMDLAGTLTADIGNLPLLQTLDLSQNRALTGPLPQSIINLKNLQTLVLVGCSFTGPLPDNIGALTQLVTLSLASNKFMGPIPPSIGNLTNLFLLDLTDNNLSGKIPVSDGTSPGIDLLVNARHFHLGKNQFAGTIPPKLFSSSMKLIHLLFDSNRLIGSLPSTIELVKSLEVIRFDRNNLGGPILLNFTSLPNLSELYLSNNNFTGPMPDLSVLKLLTYLDMSNNSFDPSLIPTWFSSLQFLTSLIMERTQLQGPAPTTLFSPPELQSLVLSNNHLNGTLDVGLGYGSQLQVIDMQNNAFTGFVVGTGYNKTLRLQGNPFCENIRPSESYCRASQPPDSTYSTPLAKNCVASRCRKNQIRSPNCNCAYPITGTVYMRSFSFSDFNNATYFSLLWESMMKAFKSEQLSVDTISLSIPVKTEDGYLRMRLEVFPSGGDRFNRTGFSVITSQMNNITFIDEPSYFGPWYFILDNENYFTGLTKSSNTGIIIGATVGASVLVLLLLLAGVYAFRQRRRAEEATQLRNPFASWDKNERSAPPDIKGVKCFTFEELKKCANDFSESNIVGTGGYGKVYKGTLSTGEVVAIKRAQQGSLQGSQEFKNEIELLSRVHHKNLVSLLGFCYELGEQMLVYEYVPNGTLKDNISGKLGTQLSWTKRLAVALDSARGIAYLHDLVDPPIIHRDIKSNNILLDDHFIAKVADFGLSKPMEEREAHVTTGVKGTMGYMDPEYFMTEQLTDKSDVYSFGVVMLELITGRKPIEHGIHVVRSVRMAMDRTKYLYNLQEILDPAISSSTMLTGLEKFSDLAIRCVEEARASRPTMGEVVKELENILQLSGLAQKEEQESIYDATGEGGFYDSHNDKAGFEYSGSVLHLEVTRE